MERIEILGTPVDKATMGETVSQIEAWWEEDAEKSLRQICTVNPEFVMQARQDGAFMSVLHGADLCVPDGVGLVYASRWMGNPLTERVAGSELVYHVADLCAKHGKSLFLLGAAEGVAAEAAEILQVLNPSLNIAGTFSGSPAGAENDPLVNMINQSAADVLFVAFGAPKQDKWIARNKAALHTVQLGIGIGGSLDFISGRSVRAPQWVQRLGLEWLHRLIKEPWRWRRMLALPKFAIRVLFGLK